MQFFSSHTDVNESRENKTLCSNEVENCVNTLESYMCVCVAGYSMNANGTCEGNIYNIYINIYIVC